MVRERPFIPYNSVVYRRLVMLGIVGRYIMTTACLGLLLIIWFYGIYTPIEQLLKKQITIVSDKQLFIDRIIQMYTMICNTQQDMQILMNQMPLVSTQSHEQQMEYCIRMIFDILASIKIPILSYTANPLIMKDNYGIYTICLTLESSLAALIDFFTQIRQKNLPIKPTYIRFNKNDTSYFAVIDMKILTCKKDPST